MCSLLTEVASLLGGHRLWGLRFSNCGAWAEWLHGMWDPPGPGIDPASPALQGGFLTPGPPGRSTLSPLFNVFPFLLSAPLLLLCILGQFPLLFFKAIKPTILRILSITLASLKVWFILVILILFSREVFFCCCCSQNVVISQFRETDATSFHISGQLLFEFEMILLPGRILFH